MSKLQLEDKNLGKPTCLDIILNPDNASETTPQAWENNGNWYYNHPGALAEAKFLGKKIPTKEDWIKICESFGDNGDRLSKEFNLLMKGYRRRSNGLYYCQGTNGHYWSYSSNTDYTFIMFFSSAIVRPALGYYSANGFSVRCLKG